MVAICSAVQTESTLKTSKVFAAMSSSSPKSWSASFETVVTETSDSLQAESPKQLFARTEIETAVDGWRSETTTPVLVGDTSTMMSETRTS